MRILSIIFLLVGLASSAYIETCPEDHEIHLCSCEEDEDSGSIIVSCGGEKQSLPRLKQSMNGLGGKKNIELQLDDIKLGTVPFNFFYGLEIKKLDISHCELDSLTDGGGPALFGLEDILEELVISSSFTEDNGPTKLQLGHMRRLKELDLSFNVITKLSNDWFDRGPASLEYIMLTNNGIEKVENRAFANLINLKQLSFDGNRFGPIQRSMLPYPAESLETLELDNNALTTIPQDIFSSMPALTGVSLTLNGLTTMDQRTWYPVWPQLQYIRLDGNPMACDSSMNWIFDARRTSAMYGKCYSPREMEGKDLQKFIDERKLWRNKQHLRN